MAYIIENDNVNNLETILDGLKKLQTKIPEIEILYKSLPTEKKYNLQIEMNDRQDSFVLNDEFKTYSGNFPEYEEFNELLKELNNIKDIYKVYNGALNSKELHQDIITELKSMMNNLDMNNKISKIMIKNIEDQFTKRFETVEQVSFVLSQTINNLIEEINEKEVEVNNDMNI